MVRVVFVFGIKFEQQKIADGHAFLRMKIQNDYIMRSRI